MCKVPLHILTSICFTPSPFCCKGELDLYNRGLFYALLVFLCFLPATIAIVSSILLLHMSFSLFLLLVYCFWKVHMIMVPFRNKILWMTYLHFSVYTLYLYSCVGVAIWTLIFTILSITLVHFGIPIPIWWLQIKRFFVPLSLLVLLAFTLKFCPFHCDCPSLQSRLHWVEHLFVN